MKSTWAVIRLPTRVPSILAMTFFVNVIGCAKIESPKEHEEAPAAAVHVCRIEKQSIVETEILIGTVQPLPTRFAKISAALEGRVVSILRDATGSVVVEGQRVKAGQEIARQEDRLAIEALKKAEAGLADLVQQKQQADFAIELSQLELKRLESMYGTSAATKSETRVVSEVLLNKAQLTKKDAISKKESVVAKMQVAQSEIRSANQLKELLTLRAPIDGQISTLQIPLGQVLQPGAVIGEVVDLSEIDVVCYVPSSVMKRLALQQEAELVDSGSGKNASETGRGNIVYLANSAAPETGNFAVKARFANANGKFRANSVMKIQVTTTPQSEKVVLPVEAFLEDEDPPGLLLLEADAPAEDSATKEDKKWKIRRVGAIVGARDRKRNLLEIVSIRLPDGKAIAISKELCFVIEHGLGLQDGDKVRVEE